MDFIPVRSKISSQFPGVFTDACWFGVEVEADNEDLQQGILFFQSKNH
jgi:hypothetical protein